MSGARMVAKKQRLEDSKVGKLSVGFLRGRPAISRTEAEADLERQATVAAILDIELGWVVSEHYAAGCNGWGGQVEPWSAKVVPFKGRTWWTRRRE